MLGWDFEDEVLSRFAFELVIWPNRLLLKDELNPRVRCAFGNVLNLVSDVVFLKNVFYGGNQMSNWILVIVSQQQSMTPQGTPLFPFVSVRDGLKETTLWMEVFSQSVSSNGPDDPGRGPDADIFVLVPPCPRATRRHQDVELGTHSILPAAAPEKTWYPFCTWQTFFNIWCDVGNGHLWC